MQYHNDLHGADVMQMMYHMITRCKLQQILKLNKLDCLSIIIAAVCHDIGHDGYTNSYHVNSISNRAVESNDVSVQETYHTAEVFRILKDPNFNFTEELSNNEFKLFRKRTMGMILATDMAKHVADLSQLKNIISQNDIKDGENVEKLMEGDENEVFKNQQFLLEVILHSADVSQQTRDFDVVKEWTYLLFEEFFDQGDLEKQQGLPISMLCDRNNTNVAAA